MNKSKCILTSDWFIAALLVLLLNDFLLKSRYPGWITGKISDFAGLFVFPLFWMAFFPKLTQLLCWATAIFFAWWKSPYSQSTIDAWNDLGLLSIGRVVDYTDMMALMVIPVAYIYSERAGKESPIKVNPIFPLLLAVFAFTATSRAWSMINMNEHYHLAMPKDTLISRLNRIDSLEFEDGYRSTTQHPDATYFKMPSALCRGVSYEVLITENADSTVDLLLLSASHRCERRKNDVAELKYEFETKVIEKVIGE